MCTIRVIISLIAKMLELMYVLEIYSLVLTAKDLFEKVNYEKITLVQLRVTGFNYNLSLHACKPESVCKIKHVTLANI